LSIKPPRLKAGDEIAIIAPAGPVAHSEIQPAIDLLASEGYRVIKSPHLFSRKGYLAGDDDTRLEDFHSVFKNDDIKAVLCARGGYGTLRILDRLDYGLVRKNPKIIVGYSDITSLLLAIYKKTGLVTFHGPVVREFHGNNWSNLRTFMDLVSTEKKMKMDLSTGTTLVKGRAEGIFLGGNLSLLSHLMGTPFMPSTKGAILLIEEKGESTYRIDRMLTQLRLGGVFDDISGLIAGQFIDCGDIPEINSLLTDFTASRKIPVFSGLRIGHGIDNITVPMGLEVDLDTEKMKLTALENCVTL
jgi:muramoyltetrapeptide carboxypeptidase